MAYRPLLLQGIVAPEGHARKTMMKAILPLILAACLLATGMAAAAELKAETTKVDLSACTFVHPGTDDLTSACPGVGGVGYVMRVIAMNMFVSYGDNALTEKALTQTFPVPNYLGLTQEWRLGDDGKPRAAIMPWITVTADGTEMPVLVVTQILPGATCQIAWLDATTLPDAMARARQIADAAGNADCSKAPEIVQPFKAF